MTIVAWGHFHTNSFITAMGALHGFITGGPFMALSLPWEPFITIVAWGHFHTYSFITAMGPFMALSLLWGPVWIFHFYRGPHIFLTRGPKFLSPALLLPTPSYS